EDGQPGTSRDHLSFVIGFCCRIGRSPRSPMDLSLMIRAVRPTDVVALRAFLGREGAVELSTHCWPKVEPESGHLPWMGILGQALGQNGARRGVWVATVGRKLLGYIVARARCDGMVWDVEHLHSGELAAATE